MASRDSAGKRIVFTGGSGIAGRNVIYRLLEHGHKILNVDINPLNNPHVHTIKADITDRAQVFNSLSCHFQVSEPFLESTQRPDAVIHFAGIPQSMRLPDNEILQVNTMGSHNVIEAACELGIKKIILASSIATYGVTYAEGGIDYPSFPLTEETITHPTDVYATSKLCMERLADSFARKFSDVDIYCLRIGAIVEPENFESKFKAYTEQPEKWKPHAWSYIDARDLGNMCHLALNKSGLGFQLFNAVNNEITNEEGASSEAFLTRVCPDTTIKKSMRQREAPVSNEKIVKMLGFEEEYNWRTILGRVDSDVK